MSKLTSYDWVWLGFAIYFVIAEGIGLVHEAKKHTDSWTLTHVLSVLIPVGIRVALIAWLAFHFLIQHKNS